MDSDQFMAAFNSLDDETKYKYKKMGEVLYNNNFNPIFDKKYEQAVQIDLMLRDGLKTTSLSEIEKEIFIEIFGLNKINEYKNNE